MGRHQFSHRKQILVTLLFQTHIVCTIPEYTGPQRDSGTKTECQVIINSGGKLSEGQPFTYVPGKISVSIKFRHQHSNAHLILFHPVSAKICSTSEKQNNIHCSILLSLHYNLKFVSSYK